MSQSVDTLGEPAADAARRPRNILTETIMLAYVTGMIYLFASAYQFGYEDVFGFTYISLGVEDLISIMREFMIPLMLGAALTVTLSFVFMLVRRTSRNSQLTSALFLLAPLCCGGVVFISAGSYWDIISVIPHDIYWLLLAYYALDVTLWRLLFRLSGSRSFRVPLDMYFRGMQVGVASLLAIIVSYDRGRVDALSIDRMELCPEFNQKQSVLVARTGDLAICAQADLAANMVYPTFFYFKIPSDGRPHLFRKIAFRPTKFGDDLMEAPR